MKLILYIALILVPTLFFAQTESKNAIAVYANYHNRSCLGGTGFCSQTEISLKSSPNAVIEKISETEVKLTINTTEFSATEFLALQKNKSISIEANSVVQTHSEIMRALQLNEKHNSFLPENYPVVFNAKSVSIVFKLN